MIDRLIDTIEMVYSSLILMIGVILAATATTLYMTTLATVVGVPRALYGSFYWREVWLGFDKLWNAILGGAHTETVSSRLGKSIYYHHPTVFGNEKLDRTVSWMLSQIEPYHCKISIDWKVGRRR